MNDIEFANRANIIIEDHGCRAILIDTDRRIINIECPPDKEIECISALEEQLGKYLFEPPQKKEFVTTLRGWPTHGT